MFKGLKKSLGSAMDTVSKEVTKAGDDISRSIDGTKRSPILDMFSTGNVVQLVSRSSGKALQIVTSPAGHLVVDGIGPEGPNVLHAHWTCVNEGNNIVKLHNNNNFLLIKDGVTQLVHYPDPALSGVEARLQLSQTGQFITLESTKEHGRHIGVLTTGEIKSALATGKEADAQFGVRLIYSPYPPGTVVTTAKK